MKKLLLQLLSLSAILFSGAMFTSCSDDEGGGGVETPVYNFAVEVTSTTAYSVGLNITSEGIVDFAYVVSEVEQPLEVIYAGGRKVTIESSPQNLTVNGFEPQTTYTLYFAARQSDNTFYNEVVSVEFTTGEFGDDEISVYNIGHKSFSAFVRFPDEVAQRGNVLKWGLNDYALFNNGLSIAHKMNLDDEFYHNYFEEDITLHLSNESRYVKDEFGNLTESSYYEPLVPNQILYFTVGEYTYVSEDEMYVYDEELGYEVDNTDGHGKPGYYKALFDQAAYENDNGGGIMPWCTSPLSEESFPDQSEYWTGYYRIYTLRTLPPEPFDGTVEVDLSGLKPMGGTIDLTPDESVPMFAVALLDLSTWDMMMTYCADQEMETIQAYLTTTHAYQGVGIKYLREATTLDINNEVWVEGPGSEYKLVVIAFDSEEMIGQNFKIYDVVLPEKQLPAPTVEVKAIANPSGEESPYELWFNVKCTSVDTAPAVSAQYAFNLEQQWQSSMAWGSTYTDIVLYAYKYFDAEEVAAMNTEAGCNVSFTTLPGQKYGFGALVINDEGTNSEAGYAEATSINEPLPAPVESEYFESLLGDWTLTATISYTEFNWDTFLEEEVQVELNTLVTIGDLTLHETLTEEVYTGFANSWSAPLTQEEVDADYAALKEQVATFNQQTRAYNRILCQGYDLYPALYGPSQTSYLSPYDCFYKASTGEYTYLGPSAILFDFGPKWYLEVGTDGQLRVPFNSMTMTPTANCNGTYLIAAVNSQDDPDMREALIYDPTTESTGYFPVTVDGDTITIEPFVKDGRNYYMHLVTADLYIESFIISDIKLTRGWSAGEETETMSQLKSTPVKLNSDCKSVSVERPKSVTRFAAPRNKVEISAVTPEQFRANIESYYLNRR